MLINMLRVNLYNMLWSLCRIVKQTRSKFYCENNLYIYDVQIVFLEIFINTLRTFINIAGKICMKIRWFLKAILDIILHWLTCVLKRNSNGDKYREKTFRKHWMVKSIKVTVNQFNSTLYTHTIDTTIKVHTLLANFIGHTKEIKRKAFLRWNGCLNKTLFE